MGKFKKQTAWVSLVIFFTVIAARAAGPTPRITGFGPAIRYVGVHGTYSFHVSASGSHLAYQWWNQEIDASQGHPIPSTLPFGVNTRRLTVTDAQNTRDYNGWYWCVVSNKLTGSAAETPRGQVVVVGPPTITEQPQSQSVSFRSRLVFSVTADAHAPVRQAYQWFFNGRAMHDRTRSTLVIPAANLHHIGTYSCRVKTLGGSTMSADASLDVVR